MALSVWELFVALFSGGDGDDEASEDEGVEGRFVPSPLDLSVRLAHGGQTVNECVPSPTWTSKRETSKHNSATSKLVD